MTLTETELFTNLPKTLNVIVAPAPTIKTRRWRTLIRIVYVPKYEKDGFMAVIPAWEPIGIPMSWDDVAVELRSEIKVDARFHCLACLGAEFWYDVKPYICER